MSFGIYVHIPYCLQRCTYCDFATYVYSPEHKEIMPPEDYLRLLKTEIESGGVADRSRTLSRTVDTVYFGGGTPSLLKPEQIHQILQWLRDVGFKFSEDCEVTIEINPATVNGQQMEELLRIGVNRFSLGLQTMKDEHLQFVKRKHSSDDTRETLKLIKSYGVNYSVDLLFALPYQTISELDRDLDQILELRPPHISPYCLTVNESHILSKLRPMDDVQLKMFDLIHRRLTEVGYDRYEISNYALPGKYSRHNSLYWDDQPYWGIGLSAHSYDPSEGEWGTRFWNPRSIRDYEKQVGQTLPKSQQEALTPWESLTDFCHISLRRSQGLCTTGLTKKFGSAALSLVKGPLEQFKSDGLLIEVSPTRWVLTDDGIKVSNQVFLGLTWSQPEWLKATKTQIRQPFVPN